jgi:hypothetical protein
MFAHLEPYMDKKIQAKSDRGTSTYTVRTLLKTEIAKCTRITGAHCGRYQVEGMIPYPFKSTFHSCCAVYKIWIDFNADKPDKYGYWNYEIRLDGSVDVKRFQETMDASVLDGKVVSGDMNTLDSVSLNSADLQNNGDLCFLTLDYVLGSIRECLEDASLPSIENKTYIETIPKKVYINGAQEPKKMNNPYGSLKVDVDDGDALVTIGQSVLTFSEKIMNIRDLI